MPSTPAVRRQQAKMETRRLILDAAYRLFEEKGYRATTMRELAATAGVGLGTIFQHFPDKAFLLVEAFETDVNKVILGAVGSLPTSDIRLQLLHVAEALFGFYFQRPRLALQVIGAVFQTEGAAAAGLRKQMDDFIAMIAGFFEKAAVRGEIAAEADVRDAALAFWSYYLMCLSMGLWDPAPEPRRGLDRLDRLLRQHLSGITG